MLEKRKAFFIDYTLIMTGCFLMAAALNVFFSPNGIDAGGITGLAVVVEHLSERYIGFKVPLWFTNFVANIPLFLIGIKIIGFKFIARTVFSTVFLSIALAVMEILPVFKGDMVLVTVFGGVLMGTGLALIFKSKATTGGTDLGATLIHKYVRHYSVATIMMLIDVLIIALGFFVFGASATLYAIVTVFIISKVIDTVLEGFSFAKCVFIISDKWDAISNEITSTLDRGVTSLYGRGIYTNKEKNVIMCVVSKKQMPQLKEVVINCDKRAFVIVADVREVLGEGFDGFE